jgi:Arc/MetJ-type ribon-helix-helix transcriptional regulator
MEIVTVRVPHEMHEEMKDLKEINWSEEIRRAIVEKLKQEKRKQALKKMDEIKAKTKGTKFDSTEFIRMMRDTR